VNLFKRDTTVPVWRGAYVHQVDGEPDLYVTTLCGIQISLADQLDRAVPNQVDCPGCFMVRSSQ
jgi:hypothetical protein